MTSILLPSTPASVHHAHRRFCGNDRYARDSELSLENLGIRRNSNLRSYLYGLEICKRYLENQENRKVEYFGHIKRKLLDKVMNIFIQQTGPDERTILGNKLSRIGLVETLCEFYDFVRNASGLQALTDMLVRDNEDDGVCLLLTIRKILCEYSAVNENVVKRLAETDFHKALLEDLRSNSGQQLHPFEKHVSDDGDVVVFNSAMNILFRCVKHPHTRRERYRQSGIIETLTPYLRCKYIEIKLRALIILTYVLVEDTKVWSEIPFDIFDFLLDSINEALLAKDRRIYGCNVTELLDCLTALHGCYHTKSHFLSKNPVPLIMSLMESGSQSEVHAAVKLVWEMSFIEQNRNILKTDEDLMYVIEALTQANDEEVRYAAKKTMFVLEEQEKRVKGYLSRKDLCKQHIMISYHLSDQKRALEIYHSLRSDGLPVWIDVAELNKYSDVLDGTLRALDQSSLIVVCFSENYAADLSCRMEAEYAFALKKRIVPLKLQSGYEPREWLTSVIGSKFYLTFTADSSFEKQINDLKTHIQGARAALTADAPVSRAVSRVQFSRGTSRAISRAISRVTSRGPSCCPVYEKDVKDWDEEDVILWATQFKLEGRAWRIVSKLTIKQILHVYAVWRRTPDYFYRWAESVIGLGSVEDLMRFRNAIRSLRDYI